MYVIKQTWTDKRLYLTTRNVYNIRKLRSKTTIDITMTSWLPEPVVQWFEYLARYALEDISGFFSICKLTSLLLFVLIVS